MDGPPPLDLTDAAGGRNPIRDLLDEIGLPWRDSRRDLAARNGIHPHRAYGWDVVEVETARPLTDGLLSPLWSNARDDFALDHPVPAFSGLSSVGPDARINLASAAAPLAKRLGRAKIGRQYNTHCCAWRAAAASITLTVWPPELSTMTLANTAHERDPRLVTACHVEISTGFRPALSQEETGWLDEFVPITQSGWHRWPTADDILKQAGPVGLLEFAREPTVSLDRLVGRAGRSRGAEALIVCSNQLYVISTEDLLGFRVERLTPAKGGGASYLVALCRSNGASPAPKRLTVTSAGGTHDLDETGPAFASAFGKDCSLEAPYPDA